MKTKGPKTQYNPWSVITQVSWMDGTHDSNGMCVMCRVPACKHPVRVERYKVVSSPLAKAWDLANPVI